MNHVAMADFIHAAEPSIAEQLGTDLDDAREFALVAMYAISRRPELYRASRESLLAALLTCARLKLVPGLGLGYLAVEREDGDVEAIFVPTYIGFIDLLERCAGLRDIRARLVFSEDRFRLHYGAHERLEHRPTKKLDRGTLLGAYAVCKLEDGSERFEHLCRGDIEPVRPDGDSPPDSARGMSSRDYGEWLKGCAVKRLAKWFTRTPEIAAAVELERASEKCKVRPRAVDVARMLGIDCSVAGPAIEATKCRCGSGAHPRRCDLHPQAFDEHVEELNREAAEDECVEQLAKDVEDERQAVEKERSDDARCCSCGNLSSVVGKLLSLTVDPRAWRGCHGCGELGVHHSMDRKCFEEHAAASAEIQEKEAARDRQRRAIADNVHKSAEKRRKKTPPGVAASPAAAVVVVSPTPPVSGAGINAPAPETSSKGFDSSSALAPEKKPTVTAEVPSDASAVTATSHIDPEPTPPFGTVFDPFKVEPRWNGAAS